MNAAEINQRLQTMPQQWPRTLRPDMMHTVTSGNAGYAIPLGCMELLREDALETTPVRARVYMQETAELLLNTVHTVFSAYMVPKLAFDRFKDGNGNPSMDSLNRAYLGQEEADGSTIPYVENIPYSSDGTDAGVFEFYKAAGMHAPSADALVNADYAEAYWQVFEFRCKQRSEALWESVKNAYAAGSLLPAFFDNPQMSMVKASFDDAMLDGEVPLNVVNSRMDVRTDAANAGHVSVLNANDERGRLRASDNVYFNTPGSDDAVAALYTEMSANGITVSVANIELGRELAAWARVRQQYEGLEDDAIIDLLMAGMSIPSQFNAQPMLLARHRVPFGMTQRYSTEAANLDVSATKGVCGADFNIRCPRVSGGGVIIVQAEVMPEQFWERSKDYHFLRTNADRRPDRLLDELDPQAVEVVENLHADVRHTDPTGLFGYAPLNHEYVRKRFNLGGKFHKVDPNEAWKQDRNRIWASEPIDPQLSKEFFLATDLPQDVFIATTEDTLEFSLVANGNISGLTFIGERLRESTGQYQAIEDRVDLSRIKPQQIAKGTGSPDEPDNAEPDEVLVSADDDDAKPKSKPSADPDPAPAAKE